MTTVTISIGVTDISARVEEADTWRNKQNNIGTCKLLFENPANVYGGVFSTNDAISIDVNGTVIWTGFVDDVKPFLSPRGHYTNKIVVTGSDRGRYGADLYVTAKYEEQNGDEIIDKINVLAGSPWGFVDPGATPDVKYECRRTYLSDAVREICDLMGYDSYITNAGVLTIFVAGASASGVALKSIAADATNNLLSFEEYEQVAKGLRNVIEVSAGSVKDHYTDENAADWSVAGAGAAVADDTAKYVYGRGSIYLTTVAAVSQAYLDFTALKYGYTTLDLSKPCQAKVCLSTECGTRTNNTVRPFMTDSSNNVIRFYRKAMGSGSKGYTELVPDWTTDPRWHILTYPLGDTCDIKAAVQSGFWYGDGAFDWTDVKYIGFEWQHAVAGEIWIDGWTIPSLNAKDIVRDGVSEGNYDTRMFHRYKKELKSMNQITALATKLLALKKDPIQKFKAVATGQVGNLYAAQTVTVQTPSHGIAGATDYIITKLHHQVRKDPITRGWDFVTIYDLVIEETQTSRVSDNQMAEYLAGLGTRLKEHEDGMMDEDILIGDAETGTRTAVESGTPFPLDPNDGDLFDLSADLTVGAAEYYGPARYWYDETLGDWYRNPITMQRAADPNAGGEVLGDELYRTDLDIWYRWTGAWTQMDVAATVITGTVSASQLKKGIQPFDSSVLVEALRVVASAAVTLDFDQDNGAGKTQITASAGTPFSDFTAGDIIVIQNSEPDATGARINDATGEIVDTVNGGGAGITLTNTVVGGADNADDETMIVSATDAVKWTGANPAVWFADGTNQNIANGSDTGLTLDNTYWAIFTVAAGVSLTNTYANAVSDTVGIIARITTRTGEEPLIFPVFNRQKSTTLDFLGAGAIDTHTLTAEALIGKIMTTSEGVQWAAGGDPGIIITPIGLRGKGAAGALMVEILATNGYITAAGGAVRIDDDGINLIDDAAGQYLIWRKATEAIKAAIYKDVNDYLVIHATDGRIRMRGHTMPLADGGFDLGMNLIRWGNIYGDDIYGRVRYSDLRSTDLTCARCGERFKKGQSLVFEVKGYESNKVNGEEMLSLPVHAQCPIIPRVRKWVHGLLR